MTETQCSSTNGVAEIARLATQAAKPHALEPGKVHALVDAAGEVHLIDLDLDKYRHRPRRKGGTFTVTDQESFAKYVEKHGMMDSEIWADQERGTVTAVINAHGKHMSELDEGDQYPGFGDHRLILKLVKSPEWLRWIANDRKLMSQRDFAELIEDRLPDIREPSSADMLEIAQTFEAKNNVRFASATILASGERELTYKEDVEAQAGRQGRLTVPTSFSLAIRPFLGFEPWKLTARFRYQIREGDLRISYALDRPEDVLDAAFSEVVAKIDETCDAPVFTGTSA